METLILKNNPQDIKTAAELLLNFEVVAFPTETVYGLGALATSEDAIKKVFAAKNRPADNPLIITVNGIDMVERFAQIDESAKKMMQSFWPGSLTVILPLKNSDLLPNIATAGLETAAFRMPDNQLTLDLISKLDTPIVGPSANSSTKPSPTTAQHVLDDLDGKISAVIDDGPTTVGVESTIVDLSIEKPVILRPGKISGLDIFNLTGIEISDFSNLNVFSNGEKQPKAPGMKYKHYAPSRPVITFDELDIQDLNRKINENDAVLAMESTLKNINIKVEKSWSLGDDSNSASEQLFAGLRAFDRPDIENIYVQRMPEIGIGIAYNNRLNKASGGNQLN